MTYGHGNSQGLPELPQQRASSSVPSNGSSRERDLTITQAAEMYGLSLRTLRRRITLGELLGHKVSGPHGREWRVSTSTLEAAGYAPRVIDLTRPDESSRSQIRRLTQALAAEQSRSSDLDQRLGYALLTVGRLRGRLREAGIDADELFGEPKAEPASGLRP